MANSTRIKFKRTTTEFSNANFQGHSIYFGEPIFIDNNHLKKEEPCKSYIAIGSNTTESPGTVQTAAIFKGFWDINKANSIVFYKSNREGLVDESGNDVYADKIITKDITNATNLENKAEKYYLLCQPDVENTNSDYRSVKTFKYGDAGIYIDTRGILHGAAWNDYAETRTIKGTVEPGDVVCEYGGGVLSLSETRLQPCPYVVSDTYGVIIGDSKDTPVAVAGRVLVKLSDFSFKIGDCVCAGPDGKAAIMTREEIKKFPDRILGIITEIPNYDEWNGVKVNNRVWIKLR